MSGERPDNGPGAAPAGAADPVPGERAVPKRGPGPLSGRSPLMQPPPR